MVTVDQNNMIDQHYVEAFRADDQQERAIVLHMVLSLVGGLLLGAVGAALFYGPDPLYAIYEPYAYLLFVVIVGRTAVGLGWAALTSALATLGTVISLLVASIFKTGNELTLGSGGAMLNLTLLVIASLGLLSYFTRRDDLWGDFAGGAMAGMVAIHAMGKALPHWPTYVPGYGPWNVLVVTGLAVGLLLFLRQGIAPRLRALLVALIIACSYFVFVVGL
ncbi:hypothetical protein [Streptosporangium sp. NBC_01756]|uniref:hypothetical protein n=1 Tax=Streptosporangium sp. NBC_01756 TaxID=2975950 RepID=UPI002DD84AB6|nr:hypothetical protein [Streptosporangium sp. NBC_01756]WSC84373.1 hypothetical protein OIE48_28835 [Streptosporangium sp. NBC_01756]